MSLSARILAFFAESLHLMPFHDFFKSCFLDLFGSLFRSFFGDVVCFTVLPGKLTPMQLRLEHSYQFFRFACAQIQLVVVVLLGRLEMFIYSFRLLRS